MKECLAAPWRRICQRKVVSLLTKMHADGATIGPIGKMTRRQGSGDDDADALKMTWYRRKKILICYLGLWNQKLPIR